MTFQKMRQKHHLKEWMLGAAEKIVRHTDWVGEQFLSTQQRRQLLN